MPTTSELLRAVPLFQGMTDAAVEAIAGLASETVFPAGTTLVREGDPSDTFLVIVDGRASVDLGGRPIRELSAGEFLGEISLIDGGPRTATVTALEPINALVVRRDGFDRLMNDFPVVRLGIVTALAQRVRQQAPTLSD